MDKHNKCKDPSSPLSSLPPSLPSPPRHFYTWVFPSRYFYHLERDQLINFYTEKQKSKINRNIQFWILKILIVWLFVLISTVKELCVYFFHFWHSGKRQKKLWGMFRHYTGRKRYENQKLTSIFSFVLSWNGRITHGPPRAPIRFYRKEKSSKDFLVRAKIPSV